MDLYEPPDKLDQQKQERRSGIPQRASPGMEVFLALLIVVPIASQHFGWLGPALAFIGAGWFIHMRRKS